VEKEVAPEKGKMWVHLINRRNWNVEYLARCSRTCSKMKHVNNFIIIILLLFFFQ